MFFFRLLRCCRSRRSLKWTVHKYEPHIFTFTVNVHTDNAHTRYPLAVYFCLSCVCTFPLLSAPHLTTSFHQPPSKLTVSLPLTTSLSQHTHTHAGVSHRLTCLCHAAALTFDILTQLPKMSANYLHTMHHTPSFTSLPPSGCLKSILRSAVSVFLCLGKGEGLRMNTVVSSLLFFLGCDYSKPAGVKGAVVNMTGWFKGCHNGLTADVLIVFITSLTWCILPL